MSLEITLARTDADIYQILELQRRNLKSNFDINNLPTDGFVTVHHTFELLKSMNDAAPHIIAKDEAKVVGYALTMLESFRTKIPVLVPMFEMFETLTYRAKPLTAFRYYVMGQICIDEAYRGIGIFDKMYRKHQEELSKRFDLCVTEVSERNRRSIRAHERVGFETIHTYEDAMDAWCVMVWDFTLGKSR